MQKITSPLIHNGHRFLLEPSTIIFKDDGEIVDILEGIQLSDAQKFEGVISPGFLNAHCHLELSYLKDLIPKNVGLVNFISSINDLRNTFTQEEILKSIADAEQQMIEYGIVAVGDICNTDYTVLQKTKENIFYHTFIEVAGVLDTIAKERFDTSLELFHKFVELHDTTIVPHAPYSVSEKLFSLINNKIKNNPISIHNQECKAENNLIKNGKGDFVPFLKKMTNNAYEPIARNKDSIQYYTPLLNNVKSTLFVHNTFTTINDVEFAKIHSNDRHWVMCPNANMYIENKLPSILDYLISENENICIGTDSLASNNKLCLMNELVTLNKQYPHLSTEQMLKWCTSNSAKALNMPFLGSLEPFRKPGIVCVLNWTDRNNMPDIPVVKRIV